MTEKARIHLLLALMLLATSPLNAAPIVSLFQAQIDASIVQPKTDPDHGQSTATGTAKFVLSYDAADPAATTFEYDMQFDGLDVAPIDATNLLDDITAIHIHDTTVCVSAALCGDGSGGQIPGSTAGTRHVLNILGVPREDDADLQVFADEDRVTGLWDPTDANNLTPAPSFSIADPAILDLLFDGKLAVMVHTNLVSSGELGGFILPIPEPTSVGLLLFAAASCTACRRSSLLTSC